MWDAGGFGFAGAEAGGPGRAGGPEAGGGGPAGPGGAAGGAPGNRGGEPGPGRFFSPGCFTGGGPGTDDAVGRPVGANGAGSTPAASSTRTASTVAPGVGAVVLSLAPSNGWTVAGDRAGRNAPTITTATKEPSGMTHRFFLYQGLGTGIAGR